MNSAQKKRGSVLAASLIIAAGVALITGTATDLANTERRLNQDAELMLEARNAAEAVVEYGFADLSARFDSNAAFPTTALAPKPGGNPLRLPNGFYELYQWSDSDARSHVVMPPYPYDPMAAWGTYNTELIGGVVPPGEWKFIDSRTPGNEFDPLRDMNVFVRAVKVYGRATVADNSGLEQTAYCSQELQIRDGPLFAYAIFYNMDMEIAPGPAMEVRGAVHANGNMYIQSGNSLSFFRQVSAVGSIYHGPMPGFGKALENGSVSFPNAAGVQTSMNSGGWIDSTSSNWRSVAANRWGGNVQDAAMGIQRHNPLAMNAYVRNNPATPTVDDALNYGYSLIMPLKTSGTVDMNIEQQKFAYKAGLTVEVNLTTGTSPTISSITLKTLRRDADGNVVYSGSMPQTTTLSIPAGIFTINNNTSLTGSGDTSTVTGGLYDKREATTVDLLEVDMNKLREAIHANNATTWGGSGKQPSAWWNGTMYVQFPLDSSDTPGPDGIQRAKKGFGVRLRNAQRVGGTPGIPDPSGGWSGAGWSGAPRGTTVATNQVMYVLGHYNADGSSSTGSATEPDDSREPPAALAADAIVVLSPTWSDAKSARSNITTQRPATQFNEVSAAFLTGLRPSDKANDNAYSGGVENFPRFLEDWSPSSQTTFRYRGSMVALFESEVATGKWGQSGVYDPPARNWGFHKLFSEGLYPPGTPNTRTYRRVNFRNLNKDEWDAQIAQLRHDLGV